MKVGFTIIFYFLSSLIYALNGDMNQVNVYIYSNKNTIIRSFAF